MGYFDSMVEPLFKTDEQGRDLFFPWGIYGKGRVLPDKETATRLRGKLKTAYVAILIAIVLLIMFGGVVREIFDGSFLMEMLIIMPIALLLGGAIQAYFLSQVRGLPISDQVLTLKEAQQAQAKSLGTVWIVLFAAISALFLAGGIFIAFAGPGDLAWAGLLLIAIFGACLLVFVRLIVLKAKRL